MSALIVTLLVLAAEPSLESALRAAVSRPGARVEVGHWSAPSTCRGQFIPASFESSGRVPVRVRGRECQAWGWATVRVFVPTAVLTRDVKANEPVDGAWTLDDVEPKGETLARIPEGATATRWLRKGQQLAPTDVRVGPKPGTPVNVKLRFGALSLEQRGTIVACAGEAICAALPSGKKVMGVFSDGTLLVGGGS